MIDDSGLIGWSGATYVSIRSSKHERFTTDAEDIDFDRLLKLREFEKTARNHIGAIKPIIIMNVDSLQPTNYTLYPKTLASAIGKFKKYNLDALFIVALAPGQAAFNIAERRIAILAQDITGLVMPHDYFARHLNLHGATVDAELERNNIQKIGSVLADVWTMDKIDGHPVLAEYIDSGTSVVDMLRPIDCRLTMNDLIDQ
jgi:hypothetical protein